MKILVKNILLFFIPILLMFCCLEIALRNIPNDYTLKNHYWETEMKNTKVLALGSSHANFGVNPVFFSEKAFNAAHVSQTLDYDLALLKKNYANLDSIQYVFLPVSYFSFFIKLSDGAEAWRLKNYFLYYHIHKLNSVNNLLEIFYSRTQK